MHHRDTTLLCGFLLLLPIGAGAAEIHKEVLSALDWELPQNTCKKPPFLGAGADIIDASGMKRRYGIDTYKLERHQRKQQRYDNCMTQYRTGLAKDFEELKSSAQYGLTQEQSNIILGKMASIHSILAPPENTEKPDS